jgi:hypothetical protein
MCRPLPRNGIYREYDRAGFRRGRACFKKVFAVDMTMFLIYFTTFFK